MSIAMFLVVLILDLHGQQTRLVRPAQPVDLSPPQTGGGAITGAVTDATTGRPVAAAIVSLEERRPGLPSRSYVQVTTPKGRFAFLDLPASDNYFLAGSKPGYLDGGYGRSDPRGPGAPVVVREGQWVGNIRMTMARPGSISGTIMDERGEPIVGASVRLLPRVLIAGQPQWLAGAVARTDDRGIYRIAGLGPGTYVVSAPSVQATLPASATVRPVQGGAGTSTADIKMANDAARLERLLVDVGGGQQLVVGRTTVPPPPTPGQRTAYPIAFYPNATNLADATPIELKASEDRSGVDFRLQPVRTARVSGVVQGPPEALGNLQLRLIPVGIEELGQGSEAATSVTESDGRFTFLDVPSGRYVLDVRHTSLELTYTSMDKVPTALLTPVALASRGGTSLHVEAAPPGVEYAATRDGAKLSYWAQQRVDVSGANVDDVVVTLRRPATMSGRVVWPSETTPPGSWLLLVLEPADGRRSLGGLSVTTSLRDNPATFTLEGLRPGEYFLRTVIGYGNAKMGSIAWEGRDYSERPFDGDDGRDITGVIVTLTTASSSLSGVVHEGNAAITSGAAVIAFPVERERWSNYGFNPTCLKSALTTSDGRYRIDGLPIGEYYLVAVPASLERAWIDPAFLASHAALASRVRIDQSGAQISNVVLSLVK